jgi:arginyl-tRNA synthetase
MIQAAHTWRPNAFCDQMYTVATAFARFFGECRVLDAEPDVRDSRLALCAATARALAVGLDTLGLAAPERL